MPIIIGQEKGQKHSIQLPSNTATKRIVTHLIERLKFIEISPSEINKMQNGQFTIIK